MNKKQILQIALLTLLLLPAQAQVNIDSLKHILATSKDDEVLAYTYNDYAFQLYRSQPDSAISYSQKALKIAQDLKLNKEIYAAYNVIGLAYQSKGLYKLSIDFLNKQFDYIENNTSDEAKVYHNIGLSYRFMGNNSKALENELQAVNILEGENDSLVLGSVYQSIANIYRDLADYKLAEDYIKKSIEIYSEIKNVGIHNKSSLLGVSYSGYANLLQVRGDIQKAIEYHELSIRLCREGGDSFNEAIGYENLGDDYALMSNYIEAIKNYYIAKKLMKQMNSGIDVGYELYKIADVYVKDKDFSKAQVYADSAITLFVENKADSYLMNAYLLKYKVYDAQNNADSALAYYKKFNAIKDSINVQSQNSELLRLKEEFETTQKEQQITLLETSNALKDKEKQQQRILKNIAIAVIGILLIMGFLIWNRNRIKQQVKQLQMRNNIAIDLHDEVGSSLSSIKMLSEIASLQNGDKNQLDEILQKINTNAKETADKMHDIIWMINPKHDQFDDILRRMEKFLFEMCSPQNIKFELNKDVDQNLKLNMQQRKDILLIFKEAVNNAVKYSNAKKITTSIQELNHFLILKIKDDGKGFNMEQIEPGNGLDSMQIRAKELNGTFQILSSENSGTEISVQIPINEK